LNYHPKAKDYMGKLIIKEEFLEHHQNKNYSILESDENDDKEIIPNKCDIIIKEGDDSSKLEENQNVSEINYNYNYECSTNEFLSNSDSNENNTKFNLKKEKNDGFTEKIVPKQQRRRKNKNKSKYSAYYDIRDNQANCLLCEAIIRKKGTTTGMKVHLESHNIFGNFDDKNTEKVENNPIISEIKNNNTRKTCDICKKNCFKFHCVKISQVGQTWYRRPLN
jgi:hypothetical protein